MPILLRVSLVVTLFLVTSCIGASLHNYGAHDQLQYGAREIDAILNQTFVGKTRDDLIIAYGPPSRTATLDNGFKLMQYNRKTTDIHEKGKKYHYNCELRLWLLDKKVHHVDYRGDQTECLDFTLNGRQNVTDDTRLHP